MLDVIAYILLAPFAMVSLVLTIGLFVGIIDKIKEHYFTKKN